MPHRFPDVTTIPKPTCLCSFLPQRSVHSLPGIINMLMLTITHIQAMALHIHTQGSFSNHTVCSLYMIMTMVLSVMGVTKMCNTVHRVGLELTSLVFWASMLPFPHVGSPDITTIPTPTCLYNSFCTQSHAHRNMHYEVHAVQPDKKITFLKV